MPKAHTPDADMQRMRVSFMNQAGELWDKHQDKFSEIMEEGEDRCIKLNFGATLDFTESKASLETTIGYSQVFKDKRSEQFDDPNQPSLFEANGHTNGDDGGMTNTEENTDDTPDGYKARNGGAKKGGKKGRETVIDTTAE